MGCRAKDIATGGTTSSNDDKDQGEQFAHGFSSVDDETSVLFVVSPALESFSSECRLKEFEKSKA